MLIILAIILAVIEMLHNKAIFKEIKNLALIHSLQLPYRIYAGVSACLAYCFYYKMSFVLTASALGLFGFVFWAVFDILVNLFMLKTNIFYVGSTAQTDIFFKNKSGLVKIVGLLIFTYLVYLKK